MEKYFKSLIVLAVLCIGPGFANRMEAKSGKHDAALASVDSGFQRIFFPLFVDGFIEPGDDQPVAGAVNAIGEAAVFRSRMILTNLHSDRNVHGLVVVWDVDGHPADIQLNDETGADGFPFELPARGTAVFSSHGDRPLRTGSVTVYADGLLSAGLVIDGPDSSAGLAPSTPLRRFVASLEFGPSLVSARNAIALMNLEDTRTPLRLVLLGPKGKKLATATLVIPPRGHLVKLIGQLPWVSNSDTAASLVGASIRGRAARGAKVAVVNLAVSPTEMWTLPVSRFR